jgi:hypothetical protein
MKPNGPANQNMTTRIVPGLKSEYRIVSLPYWAWYWLEDFMKQNRLSYQGIYNTFGDRDDVSMTLKNLAALHHEHAMREVYKLSNDNEPDETALIRRLNHKRAKRSIGAMPRIYKLFGFMPCATSLEAVWERRHYSPSNRVK